MTAGSDVTNRKPAPPLDFERTLDAPLHRVWEAWTTAEHIAKWFTPKPLTTGACVNDFRPGGEFTITMVFPDGQRHTSTARWGEIVQHEKVSFRGTLDDGLEIDTVVRFRADGNKTTVHVRQTYSFESAATKGSSMGWKSSLDQLEALARR